MNTETDSSIPQIRRAVPLLIAAAAAAFSLTLGACNTTEGVGRDIEAAGDGIEDAARDAKD